MEAVSPDRRPEDVLIVAVTERHSKTDIERFARSLDEVCS